MPAIVTLTLNPALDKSCSVNHVVAERKLRCDDVRYHPGGGGINVARAVAKLGGQAKALWMCGGASGELLKMLLADEGIEQVPIPIPGMTRENLVVFETLSGQQYRFGMPGAPLSHAEIQTCLEYLQALDPFPEYLVLSGNLPPETDERVYERIIQNVPSSCRVIVDTSGPPLQRSLGSRVFLVKPNVRELGELAGAPMENDAQIEEVAQSLINAGKTEVVVTSLGSGGVVLTSNDAHERIRAPTVKIRSKVGAGDSTVAGIVLALSRGETLSDAVRFGVAAGSAAVMTDGTELCRREDTERLYEELRRR